MTSSDERSNARKNIAGQLVIITSQVYVVISIFQTFVFLFLIDFCDKYRGWIPKGRK